MTLHGVNGAIAIASHGETTGSSETLSGTWIGHQDGQDAQAGTRRQRPPPERRSGGTRLEMIPGLMVATRGTKDVLVTTDGQDLKEIPGQMGELDMGTEAIMEIEHLAPGTVALVQTMVDWHGMAGHTTTKAVSRLGIRSQP